MNDIKTAMKAGDQQTLGVLRMVNAAIANRAIEKRGKGQPDTLTDEEVLKVLTKELKKRTEAAATFKQGNRLDLVINEEQEAVIIKKYLPEQMSVEVVAQKIAEIMRRVKPKDFGMAMKAVLAELKDKADSKLIAEIVKKALLS